MEDMEDTDDVKASPVRGDRLNITAKFKLPTILTYSDINTKIEKVRRHQTRVCCNCYSANPKPKPHCVISGKTIDFPGISCEHHRFFEEAE